MMNGVLDYIQYIVIHYNSDSQTMCRGTKLCHEDIENVPKISTQQWLYLIFNSFGLVKK